MPNTTDANPTYSRDTLEQYATDQEQHGKKPAASLIRNAINSLVEEGLLSETVECSRSELHIRLMRSVDDMAQQVKLAKDAAHVFADKVTLDLDSTIDSTKAKVEKTILPDAEETSLTAGEEVTEPFLKNPLDNL